VSRDGTVAFQESTLKIEIDNTYFYKQEAVVEIFFFFTLRVNSFRVERK